MQNIYLLLVLLMSANFLSAQAPTTPTVSVEARNVTGQSTQLSITRGDGDRRIVVISASPVAGLPTDGIDYNPDLTFGDGDQIVSGEFVMFDGIVPNFDVFTGFVPATTYYVSVFEYNGEDQMTEYITTPATTTFTTLGPPTVQVSATNVTEITGNSAKLSWTNGNGDGRIVVFREGEAVTANPVDLESYGNAGNSWRAGDEITPGNRVMFSRNGTINEFTAKQLEPLKTYFYDVFEFAGSGNGKVYAVPGESGSFTTMERPFETGALRIDNPNLPVEGDRFAFDYRRGNGEGCLFVITEGSDLNGVQPTDGIDYDTDTDFGDGDEVAPGVFALNRLTFRNFTDAFSTFAVTARSLEPGTTYTVGKYEFDYEVGFNGLVNYQLIAPATLTFTTAAAPTVQASNLSIDNNTGNSADISWDNGNGDASFLVLKADMPVDFVPEDTRPYGSNSFFGSSQGNLGGGNYGIYRGRNGTSPARNLNPGTTYHGAIWEYNGNAGPVYARPPVRFTFTASLTPTESPFDVTFSAVEGDRMTVAWRNGNGQRRLVVARANDPVTAEPADGNGRLDFGDNVFGDGTELLPGQFVVADNNEQQNSRGNDIITGLEIGTEYHFAIFEFNEDDQGNTYYRRTDPGRGNESTVSAPTTPPADLGPMDLNAVSITFDIPSGNGDGRFLVVRNADPVNFTPDDLTRYRTRLIYGEEDLGGGNSAIAYLQPGSGIPRVENLLANTTYQAAAFELNGRNFPVYNPNPTRYTFTTPQYATETAQNLEARDIGALQVRLQQFRGNGSSRIVVARLASSAPVLPQDGEVYTVNPEFGAGLDLGNGNFVVSSEDDLFRPNNRVIYDEISGLDPATDYVFTTYEVVSDGTDLFYTVPGTELALTTSAEPTVAPINLQVNDILNESATIAWTTGNGLGEVALVSQGAPVSELVATGKQVQVTTASSTNVSSMIGNAQPVYFGQQTFRNLTSLLSGTEYFVQLQAYNGWRASPAYQQSGPMTSFRTLGPPAIQASGLVITSSTDTRISLLWQKGGGTDRILVAKRGSAVDAEPVDNIEYTANTFFGSGDDLGNMNYVIAAGDFDTVSVTDLVPGEEYHFAVFEYNIQNSVLYNRDMPARVSGVAEFFLPVTWSYFRGQAIKGDAYLTWATESEEDADKFVVERQFENANFADIGELPAAGAGAGAYTYVDRDLAPGDYFYRLRQVDADGTFAYSRVIGLSVGGRGRVSVFPNPVGDWLNIQGPDTGRSQSVSGAAAGAKYVLRDARGGVVLSGTWSGQSIYVSALQPGKYFLVVDGTALPIIKR